MRTKLRPNEKKVISEKNKTSFWSAISVAWWGPGDISVTEALLLTPQNIENKKRGTWLTGTFFLTNQRIIFEGDNINKLKVIELEKLEDFYLVNKGIHVTEELKHEEKFWLSNPSEVLTHLEANYHNRILEKAKHSEEHLDYESAIKLWEKLEKPKEAARVRKLMTEQKTVKVDQTVVHGDYVDDRDTIVKDSVINRSNVGSGSSKMQELKDLTEMKEKGLIDDDEFKQMKKEILGK